MLSYNSSSPILDVYEGIFLQDFDAKMCPQKQLVQLSKTCQERDKKKRMDDIGNTHERG